MSTLSKKGKIAVSVVVCAVVIAVIVGLSVFAWLYTFDYPDGPVEKATSIELPEDGKIRILQLTDLHLTAPAWNGRDSQTLEWVKEAIRMSDPDVIAVTGDAVGSNYFYRQRDKGIVAIAEICEEAGIPWMFTYGNHDGEWSWQTGAMVGPENVEQGKEEILEVLQGYKYSLMTRGDTDGVGNYVIDVVDKDGKTVFGLINMDSHDKIFRENGEKSGYAGVTADQVAWYEREIKALNARGDGDVKSALFMHVPLYEYQDALDNYPLWGDFHSYTLQDKCYVPETNIGLYDKIAELRSTQFVTAGHDHDHNFAVMYEGPDGINADFPVILHYARCSGVNAWERRVPIGASVIDIDVLSDDVESMYKISVIEPPRDFYYDEYEGWR